MHVTRMIHQMMTESVMSNCGIDSQKTKRKKLFNNKKEKEATTNEKQTNRNKKKFV